MRKEVFASKNTIETNLEEAEIKRSFVKNHCYDFLSARKLNRIKTKESETKSLFYSKLGDNFSFVRNKHSEAEINHFVYNSFYCLLMLEFRRKKYVTSEIIEK